MINRKYRLFNFDGIKGKSSDYYRLRIAKANYIVAKHEAGMKPTDIAYSIGIEPSAVRNVLGTNRKLLKQFSPKGPKSLEFFEAYRGELYEALANNGITTFKKLEEAIKKRKLTGNGIGVCYAKAIMDILEDRFHGTRMVARVAPDVLDEAMEELNKDYCKGTTIAAEANEGDDALWILALLDSSKSKKKGIK